MQNLNAKKKMVDRNLSFTLGKIQKGRTGNQLPVVFTGLKFRAFLRILVC